MSVLRLSLMCCVLFVLASCAQPARTPVDKPYFRLIQNERVVAALQSAIDQVNAVFPTPLGALGALQGVAPFEQYTPYETGALWLVQGLVLNELERHEEAADAYLRAGPLIGYNYPGLCIALKEAVLLKGVRRDLGKCAD